MFEAVLAMPNEKLTPLSVDCNPSMTQRAGRKLWRDAIPAVAMCDLPRSLVSSAHSMAVKYLTSYSGTMPCKQPLHRTLQIAVPEDTQPTHSQYPSCHFPGKIMLL
ncbi:hypothetical protein BaRGS_00032486 [Batillaria attramentaria]|uniref:Uncharacterized protein n=1 Tax=Batillaria attramentaria TaxID=370345 RepID=A0ABD0JNN9_9CAEN